MALLTTSFNELRGGRVSVSCNYCCRVVPLDLPGGVVASEVKGAVPARPLFQFPKQLIVPIIFVT